MPDALSGQRAIFQLCDPLTLFCLSSPEAFALDLPLEMPQMFEVAPFA
ncbi:hypothetical protein [Escherichia coli]|nr:hypothetical protein [Escherichia coli]